MRLHSELFRRCWRTSMPPTFGRFKSRRTSAGHAGFSARAKSLKYRNASSPLLAMRRLSLRPDRAIASLITNTSVGLSSTSKTVRGSAEVSELDCETLSAAREEGEAEGGSSARRGLLQPDTAAVLLHDTLANRQSNAAARVLITAVQALEESENPLRILRLDSDPIVNHGKYPPAVLLDCSDLDTRSLLAAILDGVANQILEDLGEPACMDSHHGQF